MKIQVTSGGKTTIFELNDSRAAKDLYRQLPLSINVENFSNNEKIFYPPEKLDTTDTPPANAVNGSLSYYAPWGDVVMFYADFGSASGLYELGHAVSGIEHIKDMSGTILVEKKLIFLQEFFTDCSHLSFRLTNMMRETLNRRNGWQEN